MPTMIVLDVSLSMARPVVQQDTGESFTRLNLAVHGINTLLDYLSVHQKLEFVSLVAFSSLYETVSTFTRDFDSLKSKLLQLEEYDMTCIEPVLHAVDKQVLAEWGSLPCTVILVVDGNPGCGRLSLKHSLIDLLQRDDKSRFPVPFNFPGTLSVMCLAAPGDPGLTPGLPQYQRLVDLAEAESGVYVPEGGLTTKSIQAMFQKLGEDKFSPFQGTLKCGNLGSRIILSPPPRPCTKVTDFDSVKMSISDTIEVCGFIDVADVGSPAAISRHLILPYSSMKMHAFASASSDTVIDLSSGDEAEVDEGKTPSFCVLLHGALKVENMAAICLLNENWFGFVYSWADSKKKSNLMLTILEPGANVVPWLGDLNRLGSKEDYSLEMNRLSSKQDYLAANFNSWQQVGIIPQFPVRPAEKRSYSQNCVVWIKSAGIQSDLQKILRNARKLPEKTQHFYKELNRVRKAALSMGFHSLLDGMADIFEHECTMLPGSSHPDCAMQLTHAADELRKPYSRDYKFQIAPLRTKYTVHDDSDRCPM